MYRRARCHCAVGSRCAGGAPRGNIVTAATCVRIKHSNTRSLLVVNQLLPLSIRQRQYSQLVPFLSQKVHSGLTIDETADSVIDTSCQLFLRAPLFRIMQLDSLSISRWTQEHVVTSFFVLALTSVAAHCSVTIT